MEEQVTRLVNKVTSMRSLRPSLPIEMLIQLPEELNASPENYDIRRYMISISGIPGSGMWHHEHDVAVAKY